MNKTFNFPNRQRGAALIVGLVLMMVLTLLAVSTMRTSTLELAMAGNAQFHEQATQLAESGIKDAISRINANEIHPNPRDTWLVDFTEVVDAPDGGSDIGRYNVTINYKNCGDPPAGNSTEIIKADYYEIESTGLSSARNAKSILRQGFWIQRPSACTT